MDDNILDIISPSYLMPFFVYLENTNLDRVWAKRLITLEDQIPLILEANPGREMWLDMETKIRSENDTLFDLKKIESATRTCMLHFFMQYTWAGVKISIQYMHAQSDSGTCAATRRFRIQVRRSSMHALNKDPIAEPSGRL